MTQEDMILRYMQDTGSITPVDAMREFGCMRLGARIFDLRRRGIEIDTALERGTNRYGGNTQYARYSLKRTERGL